MTNILRFFQFGRKQNWLKKTRITGQVFTGLFFIGALVFLFFGGELGELLNSVGSGMGLSPLMPQDHYFWFVLTIALMGMLTVVSYLLWKNPDKFILLIPLIVAKYTSVFLALFLFALGLSNFALIAIFIVDLPLGAWSHYLYITRP